MMRAARRWITAVVGMVLWLGQLPVAAARDGGVMRINLAEKVGQQVVVRGRPAREIWQHLVGVVPGKSAAYLDLEDGNQVVAYLPKGGWPGAYVEVTAVVTEAKGRSKRPGDRTGGGDTVREYGLDVLKVVALDPGDGGHTPR